jgi:hypothetical protein
MVSTGNLEVQSKESVPGQQTRDPQSEHAETIAPQIVPGMVAQRIVESRPVRPADVLALQRSIGNRAVQRLLARRADRLGSRDANGVADGAETVVARAASSSGEALPDDVRGRFEGAIGEDLSGVRVHTGNESADAAEAVGARAYTVGQDIHFSAGAFAPSDPAGLHLLAHEVAHTVQQRGSTPARQSKLEVSTPGDPAEVEAERAADSIVAGAASSIGDATARVHRDTPPAADPQPTATPTPAVDPASTNPPATTPPGPAATTPPGPAATTPPGPGASTPASATDETVNATWKVNWDRKQTGAAVNTPSNARTGQDAASGRMNVSPEGVDSTGKAIPPKLFPWVNAASSGAAVNVGSMSHPKGKDGKVSSGIAYGKPPSATATITVAPSDSPDKKNQPSPTQISTQQKQVSAAVAAKLQDDLESMGDMEAVQTDLQTVAQAAAGASFVAKVTVKKLLDPGGGHPKTTDAVPYGQFDADGVRIVTIGVPTEVQKLKGHAAVEAQQKDASSHSQQDFHSDTTVTKLTTELTTKFQQAVASAVTNLKKQEKTSSGSLSGALGGTWDAGTAGGLSFKGLTIDIGKLAGLVLIEDPPLAWAVSKIFGTATIDGNINGHVDGSLSGSINGKTEWSDADINDTITKFSSQITNQINSQVKTSVETEVKNVTSTTQTDSHETQNKSTSSTETIGVKYIVSDKPTITVDKG